MSTRSIIAVWDDYDRVIKARYCHSDGYPAYNGAILQGHWNRPQKAASLMETTGDFSYISYTLDDCKVYEERTEPWQSTSDNYIHQLERFAINCGAEWVYLYVKNKWYVAQTTAPFEFLPLKTVLKASENPVALEFEIQA